MWNYRSVCVCVCVWKNKKNRATPHNSLRINRRSNVQRAHVCPFHKSDKSNFNKAKQTNAIDRTMYTHHTTPHQYNGCPFLPGHHQISIHFTLLWLLPPPLLLLLFSFCVASTKNMHASQNIHDKLTFYLVPFKFILYPLFEVARANIANGRRHGWRWSGGKSG